MQRQQFLALLIAAAISASLLIVYLLWIARQDALATAQTTALFFR